jgi:crossover junction endodeoxyribonuclease RuvC
LYIIDEMVILGIDPGYGRTGWGVVETIGSKLKTQNYGCIETSGSLPLEERLFEIYEKIEELIKTYKPEAIVAEELFFNTNAKTALQVGHARGVVLLLAAKRKIPFFSYTPLQIKIAVSGYGRAEKAQVGKMVQILLGLKSIPKPDDTTDALACAITHAVSYKMRRK